MRLLFCTLSLLAACFCIADAAAIVKNPEDAPAASSESGNSADLLQMLNAMQGKSSLQKFMIFMKDAKNVREIMKSLINISPLGKKILESASKRNTEIKVVLDAINGHFPDLHDIYKLTTDHNVSGLVTEALIEAKEANPDFQTMNSLALKGADPEKQIWLMTGKKVVFKPSLINAVKSGTYKLRAENVNQVNLLEFWFFIDDNWDRPFFLTGKLSDLQSLQGQIQNMSTAHLARIVSPRPGMNSTKYTVTGRNQEMMQDPDVKMMLQDIKAIGQVSDNPEGNSQAKALWTDMFLRCFKLFNKLLARAPTATSSKALKNVNSGNSANIG